MMAFLLGFGATFLTLCGIVAVVDGWGRIFARKRRERAARLLQSATRASPVALPVERSF